MTVDDWRVVNENEMPGELDAEIRRGLCLAFPDDAAVFGKTRTWHGSGPAFSLVLEDKDRVLAHVGVVDRTVTVGGRPLRAAGIMNVYVDASQRGTGLGPKIMAAAMQEALRREFDVGLLFCVFRLEKFYASLGWLALPGREVVRVDEGREAPLPDKNMAMYFPLRTRAFPDGVIHLRGNDW